MLTLENDAMTLQLSADGRDMTLIDRRRGAAWRLDPGQQQFRRRQSGGVPGPAAAFPSGRVERLGKTLHAFYTLPDGVIHAFWELRDDHVRITLAVAGDEIEMVDLPGVLRPIDGRPELLLPLLQGVLCRGGDDQWEDACELFFLSMGVILGERGALLATAEDLADWHGRIGEDKHGPFFTFQAIRCAADGWYEREVRLYPVDSDITSAAKRYRVRLKERNEFVAWEEKIARKPVLENLFGALMAFTGYNKTSGIDYADGARRLREYGFEHVLYYPVRMCHYSMDFLMGGDVPVWMSDEEIRRLKAVPGALAAPWGWYFEGLDDGSEQMARVFRRDPQGKAYDNWRIDGQQWKLVCTPCQVEESKRRFASDMRAMDWIHYDVNTTRLGGKACFAAHHDMHGGTPMGKRGDVAWIRRLIGPETNGNRIVSSEGFSDRYAISHDIGTTKFDPSEPGSRFITVPLTMLVLHDSCVHGWFETHGYNALPGFFRQPLRYGEISSGRANRKAVMDALHGSPPGVFPFGKQYGWADIGTRRTFSFLVKLEDAEVQHALQAALPVAKLHKRIGKQELVSFEFLSEDYSLQSTVFADGTRIIGNLGDRSHAAKDIGPLPPLTWREVAG